MPRDVLSSTAREDALARLATVLDALRERRALGPSSARPSSTRPSMAERSASERAASGRLVRTGWPQVDAALGGLSRSLVHEWFGVAEEPSSKTPSARRAAWTPPLRILAELAGRALAPSEPGGGLSGRSIAWIGRRVWPYPRALLPVERIAALGEPSDAASPGDAASAARPDLDPEVATPSADLLAASLFVDPPDDAVRLWAIDLAIRCPALAAVVADGRGLSMPASRRLQLAAERACAGADSAAGPLVLLARPASERGMPSVAGTRWSVTRAPLDEAAGRSSDVKGGPRWVVEVLRWKGAGGVDSPMGDLRVGALGAGALRVGALRAGTDAEIGRRWTLEWNHAEGAVVERAVLAHGSSPAAGAADPEPRAAAGGWGAVG